MKKITKYITILTTIFLLAIFWTVPTVDSAIAANDSRTPEVDVYSADKIQTIKLLQEFPSEKKPPSPILSLSKCPDKFKEQFKPCNFSATNISQALRNYERAVDQCNEGGGTIELIEDVALKMRMLQSLCQNNKAIIEDFLKNVK